MNRYLLSYGIIFLLIFGCSPKPVVFDSPWIGKPASELKAKLGKPTKIYQLQNGEKWVYTQRMEYFGKNIKRTDVALVPKKIYFIDRIYSINQSRIVVKYEVFKYNMKPIKETTSD